MASKSRQKEALGELDSALGNRYTRPREENPMSSACRSLQHFAAPDRALL
jgi:hypothetical protein